MAKTLTATLTAAISGTFKKDVDFNDQTIDQNVSQTMSNAFTNGTGANQVNQVFVDERTLADAGTEDIDLAGDLTDDFGDTITFTAIKGLLIQNQSADATLEVTPDATNGWLGPFADASDQVNIPPGGVWLVTNPTAAGWSVTASTGDLLTLTHDGTGTSTMDYKIAVIGNV